jgi:hypothetical protein
LSDAELDDELVEAVGNASDEPAAVFDAAPLAVPVDGAGD